MIEAGKAGPRVIGLTGSIGMGKSTVAQIFDELGVPTFNADGEVHAMQGPGGSLVPAIEKAFPGTTGPDGVDRKQLAEIVFGDPAQLRKLEAIVHPAVRAARRAFLDAKRDEKLIVFDIPLLFETGQAKDVDIVVVVSAPPEVQRERVLTRPDMTEERFEEILRL
ncbi:MAG TPA: dephospho-CoA kinase, partial [Sphingomonadaceae bacterium]|nr:dephospho-CoA kinase [Sphingomonadaceae bacterium]